CCIFTRQPSRISLAPLPLHAALPTSDAEVAVLGGSAEQWDCGLCVGPESGENLQDGRAESGIGPIDLFQSGDNLATRSASTRQRSQEHTSALQSRANVVYRLLLEKKQ